MIQRMLAIWSLVPLPFLKPAWTSGSSQFQIILFYIILHYSSRYSGGSHEIYPPMFQLLKDDALKVLHSICQQIWKTQQWPQDWIRSVFIAIPKKGNAKECSNYLTIALISHSSKVMLKILQARLISTWTVNFQIFKLDLEKAEEPEIKLPTSVGSWKKQESSRKTSTSALLTMSKPLTV